MRAERGQKRHASELPDQFTNLISIKAILSPTKRLFVDTKESMGLRNVLLSSPFLLSDGAPYRLLNLSCLNCQASNYLRLLALHMLNERIAYSRALFVLGYC